MASLWSAHSVYMGLLDLEKASDHVPWGTLYGDTAGVHCHLFCLWFLGTANGVQSVFTVCVVHRII